MNEADKRRLLLTRKKAILESRDALIPFARYMAPDPDARSDAARSAYEVARHHRVIAAALEEVEAGRIKRLIISCPPRHGKTRLASMLFPAWYLGRNPSKSVVFATYNDKYAVDVGGVVKNMLQSPLYAHVFPELKLDYGGAASDRLRIAGGGDMFCVGVGGTLTGRGGHCLSPNTRLSTASGLKRIADVRPGDWVSSYDFASRSQTFARVQAVASRQAARLFRIALASGRMVEATGDHRFFVDGGWKEAARLAPGDALLRDLREGLSETELRISQGSRARAQGILLLDALHGAWAQSASVWRALMRALRGIGAEGLILRNGPPRPDLLFGGLSQCREAGGARTALSGALAPLRVLQSVVSALRRQFALLFDAVQEQGACSGNAWAPEPALDGWRHGGADRSSQSEALQRDAAARPSARWREVRFVREGEPFGRPPYQREPSRQSGVESRDAMPILSSEGALGIGRDHVISVEGLCRDSVVYDVEVEGDHCFFAEGVLVHNCNILDDPIKNRQEADSLIVRDKVWNWFTSVFRTRLMTQEGAMVVVATRWQEDDLIGRLIDPSNPHYNEEEARTWKIINLPALAEEDDPLGRAIDQPLWPERFAEPFLADQRRSDPRGFTALYQGRPTPAEGAFFKSGFLRTYHKMSDMPPMDAMRFYGASDFAVATRQENDKSCHMVIGVDENDNIYVMPDIVWSRLPADMSINAVIHLMAKYKPMFWWGERGTISKSIGPFLRKQMQEKRVYCSIDEITPVADKLARAQSINARMSMGRVWFPGFTRWWADAREQLLKFPHSGQDDLVDALSLVGLGLMKQIPAKGKPKARPSEPGIYTYAWVKAQTKRAEREARLADGW